jgi:glutamate synthase (NADPH/NADH) large chain
VRNSGATAVVEGVGDHGCEYMTGGRVVVLGRTGRNFGAGMSGGIAYVHDPDYAFPGRVNFEMVSLTELDDTDQTFVRGAVEAHLRETDSQVAARLLGDWDSALGEFIKVMPNDYQRVLDATARAEREGLDVTETIMAAAQK